DLFSLGSVLYTACTGRTPFRDGSPMAVLRQVCDVTPLSIRTLIPAVPEWLVAIIERLHAKRAADRFGTAQEGADLIRYNLAHPTEPRIPPPPAVQVRPRKRRLTVLALGMLLLTLLLVGLLRWGGLLGPADPSQTRPPLAASLHGHEAPVWAIAFSPNGT